MPARGTIARGPMAGRRRGKDARSIEFHDWLRREPPFCVQPTGRSGFDSGGVGGATYRRARAPPRAARENRAQGMPPRVMNTPRAVSTDERRLVTEWFSTVRSRVFPFN